MLATPPLTLVTQQFVCLELATSPTTTNPSDEDENEQTLHQIRTSKNSVPASASLLTKTSASPKIQSNPLTIAITVASAPPSQRKTVVYTSPATSTGPIDPHSSKRVTPLITKQTVTPMTAVIPPVSNMHKDGNTKVRTNTASSSSPLLKEHSTLAMLGDLTKTSLIPENSTPRASEAARTKKSVPCSKGERLLSRKVEIPPTAEAPSISSRRASKEAVVAIEKSKADGKPEKLSGRVFKTAKSGASSLSVGEEASKIPTSKKQSQAVAKPVSAANNIGICRTLAEKKVGSIPSSGELQSQVLAIREKPDSREEEKLAAKLTPAREKAKTRSTTVCVQQTKHLSGSRSKVVSIDKAVHIFTAKKADIILNTAKAIDQTVETITTKTSIESETSAKGGAVFVVAAKFQPVTTIARDSKQTGYEEHAQLTSTAAAKETNTSEGLHDRLGVVEIPRTPNRSSKEHTLLVSESPVLQRKHQNKSILTPTSQKPHSQSVEAQISDVRSKESTKLGSNTGMNSRTQRISVQAAAIETHQPTDGSLTTRVNLTFSSPDKKSAENCRPNPLEISDKSLPSEGGNAKLPALLKSENAKKRKRKAYMMKQLEEHVQPGILSTCHKPKVFPGQLNLKRGQAQEVAGLLMEQLRDELPEYAEEIPLKFRARSSLKKQLPNCVVTPDRCERGYYKSHLDADFVNSFQNSMPKCIKIKNSVSKKGIAFISTTAATLSHTHYDQDTSFLLLLTGTKEIFYAPPSMGTLIRTSNPVISHSSNFEGINPFVELTGTSWRFAKLNAGDGLLLPQGWLHAVKSSPGTVAISFQIESSGIEATSPFLRRRRLQAPEDIRHLSTIELEDEGMGESYDKATTLKKTAGGLKMVASGSKQIIRKATNAAQVVPVIKGIANSHVIFKQNLTTTAKPVEAGKGLATTGVIKRGLANAQSLTTSTKPVEFQKGLRRTNSKPVQLDPLKQNKSSDREPPKPVNETTSSRKALEKVQAHDSIVPDKVQSRSRSRSVFVPLGLPTREVYRKKKSKGSLRRSSREKLLCGVMGCGRDPTTDTSMWVLVLSLETQDDRDESTLPMVPAYHPKHLICTECCELRASFICPEEVLNTQDKIEIPDWDQYLYYSASKVDYQKWATHAGENGKIFQALA